MTTVTDQPATTEDPARAGYITGLRQLADLLQQHPELPLPYEGSDSSGGRRLTFFYFSEPVEAFRAAARVLPGPLAKEGTDGEMPVFRLVGQLAGVHFQAVAHRDVVCERVVVGVEEVTRQVPDPSVQVPMVEVMEQVERVEWRCAPLLAAARPDEPEPSTDPGDLERLPETDPAPQDGDHQ